MSDKSVSEDDVDLITSKLSEFQKAIVQIRNISSNQLGKLDVNVKKALISEVLDEYFLLEITEEIFEGFLRLLLAFGKVFKARETFVPPVILSTFYKFILMKDDEDRNFILQNTFVHDSDVYRDALTIVVDFKLKYLEPISLIFSLFMKENYDTIIIYINKMIEKNEWQKAINWMNYFNIVDKFDFEEIVSNLYVNNANFLLKTFIGKNYNRQKRLIVYLDRLIGAKIDGGLVAVLTALEKKMIGDGKKLEKNVSKFLREYGVSESLAPNTLTIRCRDCLLYHHYQWRKNEKMQTNLEENALQAMKSNSYVRDFYLDFLCNNGFYEIAFFFAVNLDLDQNHYPLKLLNFSAGNSDKVEKICDDIALLKEIELNRHEADNECELYGLPVCIVDTWNDLEEVIKSLLKESVIGIDAEWKPNFLSITERVALIQVALSSVVYLIDVVVLEKTLSKKQWLQFFDVLLCTESIQKIGFGFFNDLRIIYNSFPFLSQLKSKFSNLICLFKMLTKVSQFPEASLAVFNTEIVLTGLNLSNVSKTFLNIELDKSEQIGNWLRRPLRAAQKKYAALDAYCVLKCFQIVYMRLSTMDNRSLYKNIHSDSLLKFGVVEKEEVDFVGPIYLESEPI